MGTWLLIGLGAAVAAIALLFALKRNKPGQAAAFQDTQAEAPAAKIAPSPASAQSTGLLSGDAFEAALDDVVQRVDRDGSSFSVLSVVLDNFALIQDGYGDDLGAEVAKLAVQRLLQCAGAGARANKTSGGEYVLLVSGGVNVATPLANRIKTELAKPFELGETKIHSTCSIGIATYPEHGARARIVGNAALAMRSLKGNGGNDYCVYDPKIAVQARDEAHLVNELRQAIEKQQFTLYFQPKIDAKSLQVTAAEALLRWHHPERGFVSPVVFIPLAEKYGLMGTIGSWVIEEACRTAAVWLESGLRMRVAVNISGYQMRQDDLVEYIESVANRYNVRPGSFTCEITETVAMEDTQATKLTFEKMRKAGFHVSIDDFGTGYSSLGSLRKLPAAELKIDRVFVSDLEESEEARSIAKSIIDMAGALSLKVVAEGVETPGQSDILVAMGCDELQGYLFSMPITAEDIQSMALNRDSSENADFRDSLFATNFIDDLE